MEIIIDQTKQLIAIQVEFRKRFPYLNIEFYNSMHRSGEGSHKENTLATHLTIEEAQTKKVSGSFKITGLMTVAELEGGFASTFGLSVQVFRKSGNIWLQTTVSDHWTLAEQNQKAMEKHENTEHGAVDAMDRMELE
jgi:hypothetical protein